MSWQDRDYARQENPFGRLGGPGGDYGGLRPALDNPMTWSVPVGRVAGIAVRVHVLLLAYIVYQLLRAAMPTAGGAVFGLVALQMTCLFLIILLHEFGHCVACRAVGGDANEILMWPLGGLAFCRPPDHWKAHFVTAAGGPLVNVAITALLAPVLGALSGVWWGVALPNPFHLDLFPTAHSLLLMALYLANWMSVTLLLFNMLPIFPLDGGRLLHALVWSRFGYSRAMRIAVRTGYVGALGLILLALLTNQAILVAIAIFGGFTCWLTSRQVTFTDEFMGYATETPASAGHARRRGPTWQQRRTRRQAERAARRERDEAALVDAILEKIAGEGMHSLTAAEKRLLRRATRRKKEAP